MIDALFIAIEKLKRENQKLTVEETLKVLDKLKDVSADKKVIKKLISHIITVERNPVKMVKLTDRENEIFQLIGLGFSSSEIGSLLSISFQTVSTHRKNIIKKLKLSGSGQLQKLAYFKVFK